MPFSNRVGARILGGSGLRKSLGSFGSLGVSVGHACTGNRKALFRAPIECAQDSAFTSLASLRNPVASSRPSPEAPGARGTSLAPGKPPPWPVPGTVHLFLSTTLRIRAVRTNPRLHRSLSHHLLRHSLQVYGQQRYTWRSPGARVGQCPARSPAWLGSAGGRHARPGTRARGHRF